MSYNETVNIIKRMQFLYNIHVLFAIFLIIRINISIVFIYFHWYLKKDNIHVKFSTNTQTTIY